MGEEAFILVKACFPSVGGHQGAEVGEGGWESKHLHVGNGRGRGDAIEGKG